ncbi:MAG: RNase A-like domain-containing protein, partial [Thermoanaerobaculia bacterium]
AERIVSETLAREADRVASWMRREKENLALDYRGESGRTIGQVLVRGESRARQAYDARVVLRKRGAQFFVLTAYPVEP